MTNDSKATGAEAVFAHELLIGDVVAHKDTLWAVQGMRPYEDQQIAMLLVTSSIVGNPRVTSLTLQPSDWFWRMPPVPVERDPDGGA